MMFFEIFENLKISDPVEKTHECHPDSSKDQEVGVRNSAAVFGVFM